MPSKPILIVDDDKAVRIALAEMLEGEGYTVAGAPSGQEALQLMRGGLHPAVILLDLMMPGMDGWDFRSEQERDPAFARVPVVIVSAAGFSHESIRTQFRPAAYLPKPLDRTKLLDAIGQLFTSETAPATEPALDAGGRSSSAPGDLETTDRAREPQDDGA